VSGTAIVPPKIAIAPNPDAARVIALVGLTLALCYLVVLCSAFLGGHFLIDAHGRPIANDFVNVWAAGRLALDGQAAAAYDWTLHKAAEIRAVGHDFANYFGWHYPPTFLFVAAALAALPYLVAAVVWQLATLTLYAATLAKILGARTGIAVALGFPAVLWNVTAGQNGFFTTALIGGTLCLLERRPVLAGVCLGLLTYKPQFGLLFPIVLIADRRWLTIFVAPRSRSHLLRLRGSFSARPVGSHFWRAYRRQAAWCSAKAAPIGTDCRVCSALSAHTAPARRWRGACKRPLRLPSRWRSSCYGEAGRHTNSKPLP
jgi:arabinofuranan 3-O-arabinosyltransferase